MAYTVQNAKCFSLNGETSGTLVPFSIREGVARDVHLYGGASLTVHSGHTASGSVVSGVGLETVNAGVTACDTILLSSGNQVIASGGTASRVSVDSYGHVLVESGGMLDGIVLNSMGGLTVSAGGTVRNGTNARTDGHSRFSFENGVASNFYLENACALYMTSGQRAVNTLISGGALTLSGAVQGDELVVSHTVCMKNNYRNQCFQRTSNS